jgi:hypothetical protein
MSGRRGHPKAALSSKEGKFHNEEREERQAERGETDGKREERGGKERKGAYRRVYKTRCCDIAFWRVAYTWAMIYIDSIPKINKSENIKKTKNELDVEYKGHFCSGCSIPPPGGVRGRVRGYGGVGLWEAGPGCACCEDYD